MAGERAKRPRFTKLEKAALLYAVVTVQAGACLDGVEEGSREEERMLKALDSATDKLRAMGAADMEA